MIIKNKYFDQNPFILAAFKEFDTRFQSKGNGLANLVSLNENTSNTVDLTKVKSSPLDKITSSPKSSLLTSSTSTSSDTFSGLGLFGGMSLTGGASSVSTTFVFSTQSTSSAINNSFSIKSPAKSSIQYKAGLNNQGSLLNLFA